MKRFYACLIFGAALFAANGCGGSGGSDSPKPTKFYINGICDVAAIDFLLNNDVDESAVPFTGSSAAFEETETLTRDIAIRETGEVEELWVEEVPFASDTDSIICALGLKDYLLEFNKRAQIARFLVDRRAPNANKSRIYVIHGFNRATGLDTPDIDFQNPGSNPQVILSDIAPFEEKHTEIDAVSQTFEVRPADSEDVYVSTTFTFGSGKVYAVLILGIEDGVGASAPQIKIIELPVE